MRQTALIIVLAWMLTSCSAMGQNFTPETFNDGGFISDQPCSAPCFFGVSPGKTNFDQAGSLLNENGYNLSCKTTPDVHVDRKVMQCDKGIWISGSTTTNLVDYISFRLNDYIYLNQVIEKYGQPTSVAVRLTSQPDYSNNAAILFYDTIQMTITLETSIESPYPVSATNVVVEVEYFDKERFEQRRGRYNPDEWKGYSSYKLTGY
jgi:hypothetical protein